MQQEQFKNDKIDVKVQETVPSAQVLENEKPNRDLVSEEPYPDTDGNEEEEKNL